MAKRARDQIDERLFRRSGDADLERNLTRAVDESSERVRDAVEKALKERLGSAKLSLSA